MDSLIEKDIPIVPGQRTSFRNALSRDLLVHMALIFIVSLLAMYLKWYYAMWWFDMPMHFWGGYAVGILGLALLLSSFRLGRPAHARAILHVMVFVLVVGAGWECFEYIVQYATGAMLANPLDSMSDIFFDLAGGALCVFHYFPQFSSLYKNKVE